MIARCTTFAFLLAAPVAQAQECSCATQMYPAKWSVYASTGVALLEVASTNQHLATAGMPSVSDDAMAFGVGALYAFGPLRVGLEYAWLDAGRESTPAGLSSRLGSSHAIVSLGYAVLKYKGVSVVPTFGVGRARMEVVVGDRLGGATPPASPPPTFDEVLASPGRSSRLEGDQWIWEPMIAADGLLLLKPGATWGVTLGVRAGYRIGPNRPDWTYKGRAASGGPVDQANGPILQVIAGYGRR